MEAASPAATARIIDASTGRCRIGEVRADGWRLGLDKIAPPVASMPLPAAGRSQPAHRAIDFPVPDAGKHREFFIHGVTAAGRPFRPSDWAERLCDVMSGYRPGGVAAGRDARIGYSPYVRPMLVGGVKCVVVDERLNDLEPMAFSFVMNFARDNELPVYEGCTIAEPSG
jgi:hypothetical protein